MTTKTKMAKAPATRRQELVAALPVAPDLATAKRTALELLKERERLGNVNKDAVPTKAQFDRFFDHIHVGADGCWLWTERLTADGLPLFWDCPDNVKDEKTGVLFGARLKVKVPMAHRTAFLWFRGLLLPYPHWKLTQACGHKACVQPAHLRQVRVAERKPITVTTAHLTQVFSQVEVVPHLQSNCWLWTGGTNLGGYAIERFDGQPIQSVDLLTFAWFSGYGEGESAVTHQLYHRCLRRRCINPAHFELVPFRTRVAKIKQSEAAAAPEEDDS